MKNLFEQKSEMEAEKRKLDKRLKNISVINNENTNNTSFKGNKSLNNSKQNIPEMMPTNIINNNNRFLEELSPEKNVLSSNMTARLELENYKNRVLIQQKSLFEELEIMKV